jgi:non-ribosomal peptide synthetase-like protein
VRLEIQSSSRPEPTDKAVAVLACKTADNAIRWQEGERLHHLWEQRCDAFAAQGDPEHPAVITDAATYSFREVDERANQVARYLIERGIGPGDRVPLLFDKTIETYVALLAVLKVNAAYVPLDAGFPAERIAFILKDAGAKAIVSLSQFKTKLDPFDLPLILLDTAKAEIDGKAAGRLGPDEAPPPADQLAYIIYTSGTTGTPKGVAIDHASICNFVRVAGEVYGMKVGDRAYQGMTIAFDFSVEELWVPLIAGATLVPGRPGATLVGDDLAEFLIEREVTVLCCVPTLLATIEQDLPKLRILLASGEACPQNLVTRWHRPGRTILNAYGPTEATVTATLTELYPDKPVTIGGPLPTYTIVILDEHKSEVVEKGALGEIGIAGIGLARGYLNRDDLTAKKFIPDFLNLPDNPSRRIYRTGDVGRINDDGEVEFLGRIDTQVKIRGYRIELGEIEAVLARLPQIGQAVVHTYEPEPGTVELVAYYTPKQGASALSLDEAWKTLRAQLPPYMVPAYLEELSAIPMTGSNKIDRKALPAPKGPRFAGGGSGYVAPRNEMEEVLARALAQTMKTDRVSVEDNFFNDLGAHSLLMAGFCAAIRRNRRTSSVSMKDIYLNPTVARLAAHLGAAEEERVEHTRVPFRIPTALEYYGCGALQLLFYAGYGALLLWLFLQGFFWAWEAIDSPFDTYLRIAAYTFGMFLLLNAIPIAAKWSLIGRFQTEVFPVWSLRYFRFWLVKSLTQSAPITVMAGSPLYNVYLRLLGARIGSNTVIRAKGLPACTDLVSIGSDTILRSDSVLITYKAQGNFIYTGPVHIGDDAIVGESSVLDTHARMEDGAQLAHASYLRSGQTVPKGKRFHGSPAQETTADFSFVDKMSCTALRRTIYTLLQLGSAFLAFAPIPLVVLIYLVPYLLSLSDGAHFFSTELVPDYVLLAAEVALFSFAAYISFWILGLLAIPIMPRLLNLLLRKDKTYVLFGFHYYVHNMVSALSNSNPYNLLFGDSALIVHYLRLVGYRLNRIVQTGSNFGLMQLHDNPFLCSVGTGTMVSDELAMINAPMSHSSFVLREVAVGDNNYLGNCITFPAAARTGANCLLATKVMVPVDGPVRENVGLLGSPPFEIPRVVERDMQCNTALGEEARARLVAQKTRYNVVTMIGYVLSLWVPAATNLFGLLVAILLYRSYGFLSLYVFGWLVVVYSLLYFALMDRASLHFRRLEPQIVSMYDRRFWFHERHWKYCGTPLSPASTSVILFKGTPFKNWLTRLGGVKLGRRVFDDGCLFFDKTMLEVGDYANLNEACAFRAHSLEEGMFKADIIKVGNGCTIGAKALVHYGVNVCDNVVIEPDSFVMKGETLDANTTWRGNPAKLAGKALFLRKQRVAEQATVREPAVAPELAIAGVPVAARSM